MGAHKYGCLVAQFDNLGCSGEVHAYQCGRPGKCRETFAFCEGHGGAKRASAECQAHMALHVQKYAKALEEISKPKGA